MFDTKLFSKLHVVMLPLTFLYLTKICLSLFFQVYLALDFSESFICSSTTVDSQQLRFPSQQTPSIVTTKSMFCEQTHIFSPDEKQKRDMALFTEYKRPHLEDKAKVCFLSWVIKLVYCFVFQDELHFNKLLRGSILFSCTNMMDIA